MRLVCVGLIMLMYTVLNKVANVPNPKGDMGVDNKKKRLDFCQDVFFDFIIFDLEVFIF